MAKHRYTRKNAPIKTYGDIDQEIERLKVEKNIMLEKALTSDNVNEVINANNYLKNINRSRPKPKSMFWLPDSFYESGQGYKETIKGVSFDVLQNMGNTFISKAIVNTRVEQIQRFLSFTTDESKEGYTIKRKINVWAKPQSVSEYSYRDQKTIEQINNFLEFGGEKTKWDVTDDFSDFIRKIVRDSLILDQLGFECIRDRLGNLKRFNAIDGSTIRLLDANDPPSYSNRTTQTPN